MKLGIRRDQPHLTVELPQSIPTGLPDSLTLRVPEGAAEAIAAIASEVSLPEVSLSDAERSLERARDLPARVAERLPAIPRVRLPFVGRLPSSLAELEGLLHLREREIRALQAHADRNLRVGLAVGTVAGVALVLALLPDREARIAEIRARLGGLDAPAEYVEDARRLVARARKSLAERVRVAREEARLVEEDTQRDLWARFEVAKRDGHQPPMA